MQETILIVYLVVAIALVGIILLQQGKGAEMGASFGAGGANTVFGAAGSGNALTKATTILAVLFFGIALSISYLNSVPTETVDAVFDEAPAVEKLDIESALPTSDDATPGVESELPAANEAATDTKTIDAAEIKTEDANANVTSIKEVVEPESTTSVEKASDKAEKKDKKDLNSAKEVKKEDNK